MNKEFAEIRGLMRFGYLSFTGRGLSYRLMEAQKVRAQPTASPAPAAIETSLVPESVRGVPAWLLMAWQIGYRF